MTPIARLAALLLAALIASSLYLVHVSYQARRLYAELDLAQNEQRTLATEAERLTAELHAQATPLRIERTARERLAMRNATPGVTQYVTLDAAAAATVHASGGAVSGAAK